MKYILMKDGRIIDLTSKQISSYEFVDDKRAIDEYGTDSGFIMVYYYDEDIGEHIEYDGKGGHSMDNWYLKDIIKQADTIEELCDEFVYKYKNPYYKEAQETYELVKMSLENMKATMEMTSGATFYGAIWTDKGLIYVAKMNEKGELELL